MFKNIVISVICLLLFAPECFAQYTRTEKTMKIQLIRNATMKITYAGRTILADPMLSPKGAMDPFAGIARNPTIDLTMKIEEVLNSVECVLITHNHPDHFDKAACDAIAKEMPIFCQGGDEEKIKEAGFTSVTPVETSREWNNIKIIRTGGKHGSGKVLEHMGKVSGFILTAKGEPIVYWVGDSIWCVEVKEAIEKYRPDIIITHSGGAKVPGFEPILMDAAQTAGLAKYAPKSSIVAIHMESLDHCTVTRESLRFEADKAGISASRLVIPKDGEILSF